LRDVGHAGAGEDRAHDRASLRDELGERAIAVDSLAYVHLGHGPEADTVDDIDEQGDVDAVVDGQREAFDHVPASCALPAQRLAELRQLWEEHFEQGPGHQLGDPAALSDDPGEGATVGGLDEADGGIAEQGAEEADDEMCGEVDDIGVEEDDHVSAAHDDGGGHGRSLASSSWRRELRRHDDGARSGGNGGCRIGRAVIDHDDLVDQVGPFDQLGLHRGNDASYGRLFVSGGEAHRHDGAVLRVGECLRIEVHVVEPTRAESGALGHERRPTSAKNSARVRSSSRTSPASAEVTVRAPSDRTPRHDMQACSASRTTPTPFGRSSASSQFATCVVSRSWTCRRRE